MELMGLLCDILRFAIWIHFGDTCLDAEECNGKGAVFGLVSTLLNTNLTLFHTRLDTWITKT